MGTFIAAFAAEYWHDRLFIAYNQLTNANIPPWTRRETQRRRIYRALWKTFLLSVLQWFDLAGIVAWKLPILGIASGGIAGGMYAVWKSMWEDWEEASARYAGMKRQKARAITRGSDGDEQSIYSDPDQLKLLEEESHGSSNH